MCYCLSVKPIVIFTSTLSLSTIFSRRYAKQTGCLDPVSHTNFRKLMCHMWFEQYVMCHKFNSLTLTQIKFLILLTVNHTLLLMFDFSQKMAIG